MFLYFEYDGQVHDEMHEVVHVLVGFYSEQDLQIQDFYFYFFGHARILIKLN